MNIHVQWTEERQSGGESEVFFVAAEHTPDGWRFFERSVWEVRWYALQPDPARIARAEALAEASA